LESDDLGLGPSDDVSAWLAKIESARKDDGMAKYEERCHLIRRKYRYEDSALVKTRKYQMLWSNIQTMQSAIYAKPPHAVVSRRFRDQDPIARTATEVLERAINFTFDAADFDTEFRMVRDEFLLYARGVARVYYEPEYETEDDSNEEIEDAEDIVGDRGTSHYGSGALGATAGFASGAPGGLGGDIGGSGPQFGGSYTSPAGSVGNLGQGDRGSPGDREPKLKFENVRIRFVQRADFRHQPARVWSEVGWVAFRAYLTRAEVKKRFGDKVGKDISVDADPVGSDAEEGREGRSGQNAAENKAVVWEIWNKAKNEVLWISPGYDDVLEKGRPYLNLDGFYPCPCPTYGTLTPDSLVPVPDFVFYQDQAAEIDQLTARIGALSDMLKLVMFYPAGPGGEGSPEIEKALSPGFENKGIAVPSNFAAFLEGSKTGVPVAFLPTDDTAKVIQACVELRKQLVEDVYQIIGISDIMRGATDPQETEGAQQLKAQYGGTRIKDRQAEIARFCRDIARLVGQVIAQYCSPQTIMEMTNIKLPSKVDLMMAQLMQASAAGQAVREPQQGMNVANMPRPIPPTGAPPQAIPRPLTPIPMGTR
jgi:hypothetical protein